jgi:hypothetical protein
MHWKLWQSLKRIKHKTKSKMRTLKLKDKMPSLQALSKRKNQKVKAKIFTKKMKLKVMLVVARINTSQKRGSKKTIKKNNKHTK